MPRAIDRIVRYALPANGIALTGAAQTVVSGLPLTGDHPMHPFAIDAAGNLYVDLGTATNSCQSQNRMPDVPGNNPCTELQTRARHLALRRQPAGPALLAGGAFRDGSAQRQEDLV